MATIKSIIYMGKYLDILGDIPKYENDFMSPEEFDSLTLDRFFILNYAPTSYEFKNFFIFKVLDKTSTTGYKGMALNKKFVENIKKAYGKM